MIFASVVMGQLEKENVVVLRSFAVRSAGENGGKKIKISVLKKQRPLTLTLVLCVGRLLLCMEIANESIVAIAATFIIATIMLSKAV